MKPRFTCFSYASTVSLMNACDSASLIGFPAMRSRYLFEDSKTCSIGKRIGLLQRGQSEIAFGRARRIRAGSMQRSACAEAQSSDYSGRPNGPSAFGLRRFEQNLAARNGDERAFHSQTSTEGSAAMPRLMIASELVEMRLFHLLWIQLPLRPTI